MTTRANELLRLLRCSEGHLTAEQMYSLAKENGLAVSLASVYRILGQLADDGLVRRINVPGAPDIFDKTTEPHAHCICPSCGAFSDFAAKDVHAMLEQAAGTKIESYDLLIHCLCPACRAQSKTKVNPAGQNAV